MTSFLQSPTRNHIRLSIYIHDAYKTFLKVVLKTITVCCYFEVVKMKYGLMRKLHIKHGKCATIIRKSIFIAKDVFPRRNKVLRNKKNSLETKKNVETRCNINHRIGQSMLNSFLTDKVKT